MGDRAGFVRLRIYPQTGTQIDRSVSNTSIDNLIMFMMNNHSKK
jgi:hypothetical protein